MGNYLTYFTDSMASVPLFILWKMLYQTMVGIGLAVVVMLFPFRATASRSVERRGRRAVAALARLLHVLVRGFVSAGMGNSGSQRGRQPLGSYNNNSGGQTGGFGGRGEMGSTPSTHHDMATTIQNLNVTTSPFTVLFITEARELLDRIEADVAAAQEELPDMEWESFTYRLLSAVLYCLPCRRKRWTTEGGIDLQYPPFMSAADVSLAPFSPASTTRFFREISAITSNAKGMVAALSTLEHATPSGHALHVEFVNHLKQDLIAMSQEYHIFCIFLEVPELHPQLVPKEMHRRSGASFLSSFFSSTINSKHDQEQQGSSRGHPSSSVSSMKGLEVYTGGLNPDLDDDQHVAAKLRERTTAKLMTRGAAQSDSSSPFSSPSRWSSSSSSDPVSSRRLDDGERETDSLGRGRGENINDIEMGPLDGPHDEHDRHGGGVRKRQSRPTSQTTSGATDGDASVSNEKNLSSQSSDDTNNDSDTASLYYEDVMSACRSFWNRYSAVRRAVFYPASRRAHAAKLQKIYERAGGVAAAGGAGAGSEALPASFYPFVYSQQQQQQEQQGQQEQQQLQQNGIIMTQSNGGAVSSSGAETAELDMELLVDEDEIAQQAVDRQPFKVQDVLAVNHFFFNLDHFVSRTLHHVAPILVPSLVDVCHRVSTAPPAFAFPDDLPPLPEDIPLNFASRVADLGLDTSRSTSAAPQATQTTTGSTSSSTVTAAAATTAAAVAARAAIGSAPGALAKDKGTTSVAGSKPTKQVTFAPDSAQTSSSSSSSTGSKPSMTFKDEESASLDNNSNNDEDNNNNNNPVDLPPEYSQGAWMSRRKHNRLHFLTKPPPPLFDKQAWLEFLCPRIVFLTFDAVRAIVYPPPEAPADPDDPACVAELARRDQGFWARRWRAFKQAVVPSEPEDILYGKSIIKVSLAIMLASLHVLIPGPFKLLVRVLYLCCRAGSAACRK